MKLVNLSRGGALIEVAARFPMRSRVRLKLTQATGEVTVAEGRVAWAKVAAIVDRQVNYLVAVIFDQPLGGSLVPDAASPEQEGFPGIEPGEAASDEDDLTSLILEARDNLTQFPSAESRRPDSSPVQEASREPAALGHPIVAVPGTLADDLQGRLGAASADIATLSTDKRILEARLAQAEEERTSLRAELEAAQRRFDEERSRIEEETAAAVTRADAVQAALKIREQEQAQALADQQERYDGVIAELLQTANDQQAEYQQMLDERTAARDEQAARAERHEAELARQRADWDGQRVDLEARLGALEARLEAAEALCAAHVARATGLRAEAEKLLSLIASPMVPDAARAQDAAQTHGAAGGAAQAVA